MITKLCNYFMDYRCHISKVILFLIIVILLLGTVILGNEKSVCDREAAIQRHRCNITNITHDCPACRYTIYLQREDGEVLSFWKDDIIVNGRVMEINNVYDCWQTGTYYYVFTDPVKPYCENVLSYFIPTLVGLIICMIIFLIITVTKDGSGYMQIFP